MHCAYVTMSHTAYMALLNEEDRGIEADLGAPTFPGLPDKNLDGVVEDGLGNPAEPEDSGTGGAGE